MPARADELAAIRHDDLLLDSLARRAPVAECATDPAARLLLALARDVDRGGYAPLPSGARWPSSQPAEHALRPLPHRGRRAARGVGVVALTVVAAFATSNGVAAAVTGDPLVGVKGVAQLVTGTADGAHPIVPTPGGSSHRR